VGLIELYQALAPTELFKERVQYNGGFLFPIAFSLKLGGKNTK
jgi:hypothetical protein